MSKKSLLIVVLISLLVFPTITVVADEGNPALGFVGFMLTGGFEDEQAPHAVFTRSTTSGTVPLKVEFDAAASVDPDGDIEEYEWDFGDGTEDEGEQVSHTYLEPGEFAVELTVTDNDRKKDSTTKTVTVKKQAPTASFEVSTSTGKVPLRVSFDASQSEDPDGEIESYQWDFGDDNDAEGKKASHTYKKVGTYTAKLTVTDDDGATDSATKKIEVSNVPNKEPTAAFSVDPSEGEVPLKVKFNASASDDPDGKIESYQWDFGDDNDAEGKTTTHTYDETGEFMARLTVTDDEGATDSATRTIKVKKKNQPPIANISAPKDDVEYKVGEKIQFSARGTEDPDGKIESYQWDFGDDNDAEGKKASHTYKKVGTYTAKLTVTDDDGATDSAAVTIEVKENQPPTANISAPKDGATFKVGEEIQFDSQDTEDPDGHIVNGKWLFGDGATSEMPAPVHSYSDPAVYEVRLEVEDDNGATAVDSIKIEILAE